MSRNGSDKKVAQLVANFQTRKTMLIVLQDYPDPDAIASAAALRLLANSQAGMSCSIAHGGVVGRAENEALVQYLDLRLHRLQDVEPGKYDVLAMVDTQPGSGNNALAPSCVPHVVIDHHPIRALTRSAAFTDVRSRYGATSTILYEYLAACEVPIDAKLATALLYGIRSDTSDLGESAVSADVEAYLALHPLANKRMLSKIQRGKVPRTYFRILMGALHRARTYEHCIVTSLDTLDQPDMVGEVADLLLRTEGVTWSLCLGYHQGQVLLSIRVTDPDVDAGKIAHRIVGKDGSGGGHRRLAGGQIPIGEDEGAEDRRKRVEGAIIARFLKAAGVQGRIGQPLI